MVEIELERERDDKERIFGIFDEILGDLIITPEASSEIERIIDESIERFDADEENKTTILDVYENFYFLAREIRRVAVQDSKEKIVDIDHFKDVMQKVSPLFPIC